MTPDNLCVIGLLYVVFFLCLIDSILFPNLQDEKLRSEKDELGVLLGNSNRDVVAKSALVMELKEKLSSMQVRVAELELAKSELNDSIQALLATIGGLKVSAFFLSSKFFMGANCQSTNSRFYPHTLPISHSNPQPRYQNTRCKNSILLACQFQSGDYAYLTCSR